MSRPQKERIVEQTPHVVYFKPKGVPLIHLDEVVLSIDEYESLRLSDHCGLTQNEGASRMGIHQSTFQRILSGARQKVSEALVTGKAIKIEGGTYRLPEEVLQGSARPGPALRGTKGEPLRCICLDCGKIVAHKRGVPCMSMTCPECGSQMMRYDE
ncbi:DUF134 domain-containing protein [archaeon]|nr:MAG: DUF134 domain-containing protein [archaeon]